MMKTEPVPDSDEEKVPRKAPRPTTGAVRERKGGFKVVAAKVAMVDDSEEDVMLPGLFWYFFVLGPSTIKIRLRVFKSF